MAGSARCRSRLYLATSLKKWEQRAPKRRREPNIERPLFPCQCDLFGRSLNRLLSRS